MHKFVKAEEIGGSLQPLLPLFRRYPPDPKTKCDVLGNVQMGKQRIVLKDHGERTLGRGKVRYVSIAD